METAQLAELQESRNELLGRVNTLKSDLSDWRGKLDTQVKTYKSVEELKGKPQGPDSLRRNGSGKKVCFPGAVKTKFV